MWLAVTDFNQLTLRQIHEQKQFHVRPAPVAFSQKKKKKSAHFRTQPKWWWLACCGWWKKCLAAYLNQIKYTKYIGNYGIALCRASKNLVFRIFLNCTTFLSIHCTHVFQRMTCSRLALNNFLCLWDYDCVNFYFFFQLRSLWSLWSF